MFLPCFFSSLLTLDSTLMEALKAAAEMVAKKGKTIIVMSGDERVSIVQ